MSTLLPRKLAQDREPWERQPGETMKAYAAFLGYRAQSPHRRSLRQLATQIAKNAPLVRRWSAAWQWQFRVEQWDQHQENERLADIRDQQKKERENWLVLGHALMKLGGEKLAALQAVDLNPAQASVFVARGVAVARAALVPIPDKVSLGAGEVLDGLDGGTIIVADGTEEQYVGAIREALRREGRLPDR